MTAYPYWGIDGCKSGWIAIGLHDDGAHLAELVPDISTFWQKHGATARRVLIDMPVGLADPDHPRDVEPRARQLLGKRRSSVFAVPVRDAIAYGAQHGFTSQNYAAACDLNRAVEGRAFSKQSWNIAPKIHEVDALLRTTPAAQSIFTEAHPELLFYALNDSQPMRYSKKLGLGFTERLQALLPYCPDALEIIRVTYDMHSKSLADDDVVDALACAVSARLGNLVQIPEDPPRDAHGLPMRMVYPQV